jgi:tellurite resistance protein TerC
MLVTTIPGGSLPLPSVHAPANLVFWLLFLAFVLVMLVLDLRVFHREPRAASLRESLLWTALWVGLAAVFALLLYFHGHRMTGDTLVSNRTLTAEFVTGYLVEEALSIDNLFVFLVIFRYFKVPLRLQHPVLFWGILGAILLRGVFIVAGVVLLNRFQWIGYLFGAFLIYAGVELFLEREGPSDPANTLVVRFARRHLRLTGDFSGAAFTVRRNGVRYFTTLALVLLVVETTDVIFAIDSIPAVLAITRDPFIVFTSNIFAILGLRALYFALAGLIDLFKQLHYGLAVVLVFIGAKMIAGRFFEIPTSYTLAIVVLAVALSLLPALWRRRSGEAS